MSKLRFTTDLEKQIVAVVSGSGGTSSLLCKAPNFSTSENLTHGVFVVVCFCFQFQCLIIFFLYCILPFRAANFSTPENLSHHTIITFWTPTYLTTLIPRVSASSTRRGFTSRTVTITFRQAGAELRMLRKFDCNFYVFTNHHALLSQFPPHQRQL